MELYDIAPTPDFWDTLYSARSFQKSFDHIFGPSKVIFDGSDAVKF
jgi:hypothetical protein